MRLEVPLEDGTSIFLESGSEVPDYEPEPSDPADAGPEPEAEAVAKRTSYHSSGVSYDSSVNTQLAVNTAVTAAIIAANAAIL